MTIKFTINEDIFNELDVVEYPENYESLNNVGLTFDEYSDIRRRMATKAFEESRDDYFDEDYEPSDYEIDDVICDIENDMIQVVRFYRFSTLAWGLAAWYGSFEEMENKVRNLVEYDDYYYYETGIGYDTISSDLLGRKADGVAKSEFIDFLNQSIVDNWNKK